MPYGIFSQSFGNVALGLMFVYRLSLWLILDFFGSTAPLFLGSEVVAMMSRTKLLLPSQLLLLEAQFRIHHQRQSPRAVLIAAMGKKAAQPDPQLVAARASAAQPAVQTARAAQPASQPAAASDSAAQPATLPLRELTKRSAQFGAWSVVVTSSD